MLVTSAFWMGCTYLFGIILPWFVWPQPTALLPPGRLWTSKLAKSAYRTSSPICQCKSFLLEGCQAVLSLCQLAEDYKCGFAWNDEGAALIDHAGHLRESEVRNYTPFLGQGYVFQAPDKNADAAAPEASIHDFLLVTKGHVERDEGNPGMIHDLTNLRKTHSGDVCQAKIKMYLAKQKKPFLRAHPSDWMKTLLADRISSSDLKFPDMNMFYRNKKTSIQQSAAKNKKGLVSG